MHLHLVKGFNIYGWHKAAYNSKRVLLALKESAKLLALNNFSHLFYSE